MATVIEEVGVRHSHAVTCPGPVSVASKPPHVLLIDDDELFGALMVAVANARGVKLSYFPSLEAAGHIGAIGGYDAAILDYYLNRFTGAEIAEYFDAFFSKTPVFVVSGRETYPDAGPPPKCLRKFLCKVIGPQKILDEVLAAISPNGYPKELT